MLREQWKRIECDSLLGPEPVPVIEPAVLAERRSDAIAIDDAVAATRCGDERHAHLASHRLPGPRDTRSEMTERGLRTKWRADVNDPRAQPLMNDRPERSPALDLDLHRLVRAVAEFRKLQRPLVRNEDDVVRPEFAQTASRIENLLLILVVRRLVDVEVDPGTECGEREDMRELARGERAADCNPGRSRYRRRLLCTHFCQERRSGHPRKELELRVAQTFQPHISRPDLPEIDQTARQLQQQGSVRPAGRSDGVEIDVSSFQGSMPLDQRIGARYGLV